MVIEAHGATDTVRGETYMRCQVAGGQITSFSLQSCGLLRLIDGQQLALRVLLTLQLGNGLVPLVDICCIRKDGSVAAAFSREMCDCKSTIKQLVEQLKCWQTWSKLQGGPQREATKGSERRHDQSHLLQTILLEWHSHTKKKLAGHASTLWASQLLERTRLRRTLHAWRVAHWKGQTATAKSAAVEEEAATHRLADRALVEGDEASAQLRERQHNTEQHLAAAIQGREEVVAELTAAKAEIQHKQSKITALSAETDYLRQHLAERDATLRQATEAAEQAADEQACLASQLLELRLAAGNSHMHPNPPQHSGRSSSSPLLSRSLAGVSGASHVSRDLHIAQLEEELAHWQEQAMSLEAAVKQANERAEHAEAQAKEDLAAVDSLSRLLTGVMGDVGFESAGPASDLGQSLAGKPGIAASGRATMEALRSSRLGQLLQESYGTSILHPSSDGRTKDPLLGRTGTQQCTISVTGRQSALSELRSPQQAPASKQAHSCEQNVGLSQGIGFHLDAQKRAAANPTRAGKYNLQGIGRHRSAAVVQAGTEPGAKSTPGTHSTHIPTGLAGPQTTVAHTSQPLVPGATSTVPQEGIGAAAATHFQRRNVGGVHVRSHGPGGSHRCQEPVKESRFRLLGAERNAMAASPKDPRAPKDLEHEECMLQAKSSARQGQGLAALVEGKGRRSKRGIEHERAGIIELRGSSSGDEGFTPGLHIIYDAATSQPYDMSLVR